MGCDIHEFIEVRKDDKSPWHLNEHPVFRCWKYEYPSTDEEEFTQEEVLRDTPQLDRWYGLFGWLADVRNYSQVVPLSPPKGLPDDLCKEFDLEMVDHTPSWFTAEELFAVDYNQPIIDYRHSDGGELRTLRNFLGGSWIKFLEDLRKLPYAPTDIRFTFYFDS